MRRVVQVVLCAALCREPAAGQVQAPYRLPDRVRTYYGPPRHYEPVPSHLAFSADGRRLYAIGGQYSERFDLGDLPRVRGYELASGRVTHFLGASGDRLIRADGTARPQPVRGRPDGRFRGMSFLPGTETVVAIGPRQGLMMLDPESGDRVRPEQASVTAVKLSLSADGRRVMENRDEKGLRILDLTTWPEYWLPQTKKEAALPSALSADGRVVAVARRAGTVDLIDLDNRSDRQTVILPGSPTAAPTALDFSPDGRVLALATSADVTLISLHDNRVAGTYRAFDGRDEVRLAFSRDGKKLAVVAGPRVDVIEVSGQRRLFRHDVPSGSAWPVAFSPDGTALACHAPGFAFRVWDLESGAERYTPAGHGTGLVNAIGTADGKQVVTLGREPGLCVWDAATGRYLNRGLGSPFEAAGPAVLSPDGRTIAALETDGRVSWLEVRTGQRVASEPRVRGAAVLALSADGRTMLAIGSGAEAVAVDVSSGVERWSAIGRDNGGLSAIGTPDGSSFLVGGAGGSLRRRDARTGEDLWHVSAGLAPIIRLAVSPDGARAAAGNTSGQIFLVSVRDGSRQEIIETGRGHIGALAFSPDGRLLAYARDAADTGPGPVIVRELATGTAVARTDDHPGRALALWFSPDGQDLFSASAQGFALRWEWLPGSDRDVADPDDLVMAWYLLADNDGAFAQAAMSRLLRNPVAAVRAFREAQGPESEGFAPRVRRLVERLDHPRFPVRERTSRQLTQIGLWAEGDLLRAARKPPSEEVGRRATELLRRIGDPGARWSEGGLRRVRSCVVLDQIGTPEARALLADLRKSWPEAKAHQDRPAAVVAADPLDVLSAVRARGLRPPVSDR